jgi:arylsulfatase A-like enzyme
MTSRPASHGEPGSEIVDGAIEFLRHRSDPRPFFMYLGFANPHDPRTAARSYLDRYQEERLALPKNFLPVHPFDNGDMTVRDETLLPWPRKEADLRRTLRDYYATITALDHHIGRLLTELDRLKLLERTLIIFSSDQGVALGSHGLLGKQNLYDCDHEGAAGVRRPRPAPRGFRGAGLPARPLSDPLRPGRCARPYRD